MLKQRYRPALVALWLLLLLLLPAGRGPAGRGPAGASAEALPAPAGATAHAIMFWMDGCPHCHAVIDEVLPPLHQRYGAQFDIQLVELTRAAQFDDLARLAAEVGLSRDSVGVPFLLIGEHVLVGSAEISGQLPLLIERYLAAGGVDFPTWSALAPLLPPDLAAALAAAPAADGPRALTAAESAAPAAAAPAAAAPAAAAPAAPTRSGFTLAVVILVGMLLALAYALRRLWRGEVRGTPGGVWLPLLALGGLAVAAYLAYVETQAVPAICGPVGDCNAVQSSPYAVLFGVPIGVLGVVGYLVILAAWGWGAWAARRAAPPRAPLLLPALTAFGVLFSIYLTFLEPFVIGAVCAWCLTSAVIMTLLLLLSVTAGGGRFDKPSNL